MNEKYMPVNTNPISVEEAQLISAEVLSYVGDSVHSLYVRSRLAVCNKCKIKVHHGIAAKEVSAPTQAEAIKRKEAILTEDELAIFKRCRNVHKQFVYGQRHKYLIQYTLLV